MNRRYLKGIMTAWAILVLLSVSLPLPAELPEILPIEAFFGGGAKGGATISPDGKYIAYLAPVENTITVWIKSRDKNDDRPVSRDPKLAIGNYDWAMDSRHLIFMQDSGGDENFHIYALNVETGVVRDLAAFKEVKAQNLLMAKDRPGEILVGLNVRDKRYVDMYRIDLNTGKIVLDTENPGDVRWWLADHNLVVRAAVALNPADISTILRVRDGADKPWRDLITWPFGATGHLEGYGSQLAVSFTRDGKALYVVAAFNGDNTGLALVDVATGQALKHIAQKPGEDVWTIMDANLYDHAQILFHPVTWEVQAVAFNYLKPSWMVLDAVLQKDFEELAKVAPGNIFITSRDLSDRWWTVVFGADTASRLVYLYDRETKKAELLFETAPQMKKYTFAKQEPLVIKARDGVSIPCYLTLPAGIPAKNLPLVMLIHGGPWTRDDWGFDPIGQFLANRGYAVLQVNYRGSSGFGRKFMDAGNGQWGVGIMQHDVTDAAEWLVKEGVADRKRIGIIGGSYGGYATLAGLAFTPELYVCGVDMCGPSNVKTSVESMPDWWYLIKQRWLRRIGNVLTDDALNRRISPFYHADKIKGSLLIIHGKNDPRVKIEESNQIVAAMRRNKRQVIYVVYPDEGHGPNQPQNIMDMMKRVEIFLAEHLGGRALPWQPVPGSSAELH